MVKKGIIIDADECQRDTSILECQHTDIQEYTRGHVKVLKHLQLKEEPTDCDLSS